MGVEVGMKREVTVIDDEKEVGESLRECLGSRGFYINHFISAEDFLSAPRTGDAMIYLVDERLPGIKGQDVIRTIRTKDKFSPIYMISGNGQTADVLAALKAGADDYLVKPLDLDTLIVRIENAWTKHDLLESHLISRGLKLIPEAHSVIKDGATASLTAREYIIFEYLYRSGATVSREKLIEQFDAKEKMTVRNIDVHVFALRKKLSKISISIRTVWGAGYQLELE